MFDILSIISAIQLVAPQLSSDTINTYADAIEKQVETTTPDISPLTYITIIAHESNFRPNAISQDGMDYGLMQIRAIYYKAPANNLFDPLANIKAGGHILSESKKVCRKILHREPSLEELISVYAGSLPSCRPNHLTSVIIKFQNCLEDAVVRGLEKNQCSF